MSNDLIERAASAMQNAVIRDDEGEFPRLFDLLDFSGENKAVTVTRGLAAAAVEAIVNTPETVDFMSGVPLEAIHQRERWGAAHDAGKSPFDWFWLVGYLAQKAADAHVRGDAEKARHHTISTAAALANWHLALADGTDMRPGIGPGNGGDKPGSAFDLADKLQ